MSRRTLWAALAALLSNGGGASNQTQTIWLIGMGPFTGGVWDAFVSSRVGADIMLEEVNANPNLLPGYELRVAWQDSQCSDRVGSNLLVKNMAWQEYDVFAPGKAISELDRDRDGLIETSDVAVWQEVWNSSVVDPPPVGLLGGGCSSVTIPLAKIAPRWRLPQVSPTASRPSLSDRSVYPYFFRTQVPDTLFSYGWFAIARGLGIQSALPVMSAVGFAGTASVMQAAAVAEGVQLVGRDFTSEVPGFYGLKVKEGDRDSSVAAADDMLVYNQRIAVMGLYGASNRLVLCEAYRKGIRNVVFMFVGWIAHGWWDVEDTLCTRAQMRQMSLGYIGAEQQMYRTDTATLLDCTTSMTMAQFTTEMWRRQNATPWDFTAHPHGFIPRTEVAVTADAVCVYAKALHDVLITQGVLTLQDLSGRTEAAFSAMNAAFQRTRFEGVSGTFEFLPGSGDPEATILIKQLQDDNGVFKFTEIAHYRQNLVYLGQGNLVFQYPGEVFAAGPAGATTITGTLAQFRTCTDNKVLDMSTNQCVDCPQNMTFVQFASACKCKEGFFENSTSGGCSQCPAGTYSTAAGTLECTPCSLGYYSDPGATTCSFCPKGTYSDVMGLGVCKTCPALRTTPTIASQSVSDCICDMTAYSDGNGGCRSCPLGSTTTALNSPSVASCLCPANSYMDVGGCSACPSGASTHGGGHTNSSSCRCRRDTYMQAGMCIQCPRDSNTTDEGSTSRNACLCAKDLYLPLTGGSCVACPDGMTCPLGSNEANTAFLTLATKSPMQEFPKLQPMFWASLDDPMSIFSCRSDFHCPGNRYPGDACAPFLQGQACDSCVEGYHWNGKACEPCSAKRAGDLETFGLTFPVVPGFYIPMTLAGLYRAATGLEFNYFFFPVLPILCLPVVIIIFYRFFGDTFEKWGSYKTAIATIFFIELNHYQMIDLMLTVNTEFPYFITRILGIWGSTNTAWSGFRLDCGGLADVKSTVIIKGLTPVVCVACCALVYGGSLLAAKLAKKAWLEMSADRMLNLIGTTLYTFYSPIASLSLLLFKCQGNPNSTKSLAVDKSVVCFTSEKWKELLPAGVTLLLVYSIGMGGLFIRTVIVAPGHFSDPTFQARWKFLFIKYRANVFWWAAAYLAMNFFVNMGFVISSEGVAQLHLTILMTGMYMAFLIVKSPYRHRLMNLMDILARVSITFTSALLTWHIDKEQERNLVNNVIDMSAFIISLMPIFAAVGAVVHMHRYGKRFPHTIEEEREAEREFKEMVDHIVELSILTKEEGADVILSMEEWDRFNVKQALHAISSDIMNKETKTRVVDKTRFQVRQRTANVRASGIHRHISEHTERITGRSSSFRSSSFSRAGSRVATPDPESEAALQDLRTRTWQQVQV